MRILGIDPGLDGAFALLDELGHLSDVLDMPTLEIKVSGKKRRTIDETEVGRILRQIAPGQVYLERASAMPPAKDRQGNPRAGARMGTVAAFNYGAGFGALRGALGALEIPYELVAPATWKKAMMPGQGREKDASRQVAKQLYPHAELHLKKHHGRADAILIATFGRRRVLGEAA